MIAKRMCAGVGLLCLWSSWVLAQDIPGMSTPEKEHEWLKQFVGEWTSEAEASMGPGQPTIVCHGTMKSRMLGDLWVITESTADMQGTKVSAVQTIGYDAEKKKYVGTWVDSMMNHMWQYEGTVDASGKKIMLEAKGPSFVEAGKSANFRDSYEFKSNDHIIMTSEMQGPDGKWVTFMTANVRRTK